MNVLLTLFDFVLDYVLIVAIFGFAAASLYFSFKNYGMIHNGSDEKRILRYWSVVCFAWLAIYIMITSMSMENIRAFGYILARPTIALTLGVLLSDLISRNRYHNGKKDGDK